MPQSILLVGASRGIGAVMAGEMAARGWQVTGTVRGADRTPLHDLAEAHPGAVAIETVDIAEPDQIAALAGRLQGRRFDIVFVNAGVAGTDPAETFADVTTEEFIRVMVTNVLGAMRAVEALAPLAAEGGIVGVMSSQQGSVTLNTVGYYDVYRSSKSALNQAMASYATRHKDDGRAIVLMAPGWIRTALGGEGAPVSAEEAVPEIVDALLAQLGQTGLLYVDRQGATVPW